MPKCTCVCGATYRVPDAAARSPRPVQEMRLPFRSGRRRNRSDSVADFPSQSPSTGEAIGVSSAAVAPGASGDDGVEVWRAATPRPTGRFPVQRPPVVTVRASSGRYSFLPTLADC